MTDLSRRSFVKLTAGGLLIPESAAAMPPHPDNDQRPLHAILADAEIAVDELDRRYLVERRGPDGKWRPSARLLRSSTHLPASITATADRWHLSNGERITMLDRHFTVSVRTMKAKDEA